MLYGTNAIGFFDVYAFENMEYIPLVEASDIRKTIIQSPGSVASKLSTRARLSGLSSMSRLSVRPHEIEKVRKYLVKTLSDHGAIIPSGLEA